MSKKHESDVTSRAAFEQHLLGIDFLRMLSILLVMFYHYTWWNQTRGQPFSQVEGVANLVWGQYFASGWIGVEIFFVISGYVIAYSSAGSSAIGFFQSRLFRLFPVNFICATLVLLIIFFDPHYREGLPHSRALLLWAQTVAFWPLNSIDGPWWTLGIEINFYLLTCWLLFKRRLRNFEFVMMTLGCVSLAFWASAITLPLMLVNYDTAFFVTFRYLIDKAMGNRELQLFLVQHACFFGCGVFLYKILMAGLTKRRIVCIMILIGACVLEIIGQTKIISRATGLPLSIIPPIVIWLLSIVLLVASIVWNTKISDRLSRYKKIIKFLGLTTYPMYLIHNAVGTVYISHFLPYQGAFSIFAAIATSVFISILIAKFPEPLLRHLLGRLWPRIQRPARTLPSNFQ